MISMFGEIFNGGQKQVIHSTKPVDYKSKDIFLISTSQADKYKECKKKWMLNYYQKILGEELDFYPFKYGNFVHGILEGLMNRKIEDRTSALYDLLNYEDFPVPDSFVTKFYKFISNVESLLVKYKNIVSNSCELPLAIAAPMDWFHKDFSSALKNVMLPSKEFRSFSGFGYRGKIDYYGEDIETGEKCLVDFKTGRLSVKRKDKYEQQVFKYQVLGEVNGLKVDSVRIEFIEGEFVYDRVLKYNANYDYGEKFIKKDLKIISKALMKEPIPKNFPKKKSENCSTCQYAPFCLVEEKEQISNLFFKSVIKKSQHLYKL